jgi:hypothetical protein
VYSFVVRLFMVAREQMKIKRKRACSGDRAMSLACLHSRLFDLSFRVDVCYFFLY